MSIVWSQLAIEDRLQIFDYIASENPIAAIDCDEAIGRQSRNHRGIDVRAIPNGVQVGSGVAINNWPEDGAGVGTSTTSPMPVLRD